MHVLFLSSSGKVIAFFDKNSTKNRIIKKKACIFKSWWNIKLLVFLWRWTQGLYSLSGKTTSRQI